MTDERMMHYTPEYIVRQARNINLLNATIRVLRARLTTGAFVKFKTDPNGVAHVFLLADEETAFRVNGILSMEYECEVIYD